MKVQGRCYSGQLLQVNKNKVYADCSCHRAVSTLLGQNTSQSQGLRVSTPGTAGIASRVRHPSAPPPFFREVANRLMQQRPGSLSGRLHHTLSAPLCQCSSVFAGVRLGHRLFISVTLRLLTTHGFPPSRSANIRGCAPPWFALLASVHPRCSRRLSASYSPRIFFRHRISSSPPKKARITPSRAAGSWPVRLRIRRA